MASSAAPLAANVLVRWAIDVEAVLTQILLVGVVGASLAVGLLARSRIAYGLTLAIGLAAVAWWVDLSLARDPVALHRLAVLVGASGLLVVAGLVLDRAAFWQPHGGSDDDAPVNPRRAADRAWRPPR